MLEIFDAGPGWVYGFLMDFGAKQTAGRDDQAVGIGIGSVTRMEFDAGAADWYPGFADVLFHRLLRMYG
ncbi:MAG: hypothetical protein ACK4E4_04255 [Rhodocyclaceae bacterium]